jgi:hypothetical protein
VGDFIHLSPIAGVEEPSVPTAIVANGRVIACKTEWEIKYDEQMEEAAKKLLHLCKILKGEGKYYQLSAPIPLFKKGWFHQQGPDLLFSYKRGKRWEAKVVGNRMPQYCAFKPVYYDMANVSCFLDPPKEICVVNSPKYGENDVVSFRWGNSKTYSLALERMSTAPDEPDIIP